MFKIYSLFIFMVFTTTMIHCDLTNLNEFLKFFKQNSSVNYPVGFLSQANLDVVKRYLPANVEARFFQSLTQLLNAIDNETIIAGVTTGLLAEDLGTRYHVFSSLIISPQAMLLAPDYDTISTPYGLQNTSSNDLFVALNAAIADIQREDIDETLFITYNLTDLPRVYTCRQNKQLPVVNRNVTSGFLRDILFNGASLRIGGIGPYNWSVHDGNYQVDSPTGFYPELLEEIVKKLGQLKDPNGDSYNARIKIERRYYSNVTSLFRDLLNGDIHATDVYTFVDVPYNGTGEKCSSGSQCRARESCENSICTHPERPRSLHFRTTCTTAGRDTKFISKLRGASKTSQTDTPRETPKTRWIGYILIFAALFGGIFVTLLILIRRKKNYRIEHTLPGGFGKFARLEEESEAPMDGIDSFTDHVVQSPRDNTNSTS